MLRKIKCNSSLLKQEEWSDVVDDDDDIASCVFVRVLSCVLSLAMVRNFLITMLKFE